MSMTMKIPSSVIPELVEWLMSDRYYTIPITPSRPLGRASMTVTQQTISLWDAYGHFPNLFPDVLAAALHSFNEYHREVPEVEDG